MSSKYKHSEEKTKIIMMELYLPICAEKCITNLSKPLDDVEKVCLAKCVDRAHDYLMLVEKKIN